VFKPTPPERLSQQCRKPFRAELTCRFGGVGERSIARFRSLRKLPICRHKGPLETADDNFKPASVSMSAGSSLSSAPLASPPGRRSQEQHKRTTLTVVALRVPALHTAALSIHCAERACSLFQRSAKSYHRRCAQVLEMRRRTTWHGHRHAMKTCKYVLHGTDEREGVNAKIERVRKYLSRHCRPGRTCGSESRSVCSPCSEYGALTKPRRSSRTLL
jgi:hypothetical protein